MPDARRSAQQTDGSFEQIKQAIIARTGHHYYADKDHLLRERLDRRLTATGCGSFKEYLALLGQPRKGAAEWQELESEVTIGETFFFRHAEQFAALRDIILPDLIRAQRRRRALRIWSAGCAIGAEPYSIAILVERLLGPDLRDWTVEIVGSDISARALAQAQEGLFSEWALRGMPPAAREKDFTFMPDCRRWRIAERHRMRLRFVRHNLLSLPEQGESPAWAGFDLILCRNVLIYFGADRIAPTLSALARCLSPTGWLMIGHSDAIAALPRDLRVVELGGTMAFRLPARGMAAESEATRWAMPPACLPYPSFEPLLAEPLPVEFDEVAPPEKAEPAQRDMATESKAAGSTAVGRTAPSLAAIRALADAGRLAQAAEACRLAIEADPFDPHLHFYDGVVAQAGGDISAAEAALRRAVYLSGEMIMAHYHLGLLLLDGPAPEAGRRSMAQVVKLCANLPDDAILPESDGLTPRELVERVRLRLRARHGGGRGETRIR
jgi:chemotaxis protein methyltransferase CheR